MIKNTLIALAILLSPLASQASDYEEIQSFKEAKISLTKAIKIAEKNQKGKALSAEIEDNAQSPTYEVKVLTGTKVYEVTVDAVTGKVVHTKMD